MSGAAYFFLQGCGEPIESFVRSLSATVKLGERSMSFGSLTYVFSLLQGSLMECALVFTLMIKRADSKLELRSLEQARYAPHHWKGVLFRSANI